MTKWIYCELHERPPQLAYRKVTLAYRGSPVDTVISVVARPAAALVEQAKRALGQEGQPT